MKCIVNVRSCHTRCRNGRKQLENGLAHTHLVNHSLMRMFTNKQTSKALFRKKRFELNFLFWWNAPKFAIFIEKENPCSFFRFSFRAFLSFYFTNALVYVNIDQSIHKVKPKVDQKWKVKKIAWVFFFYKYGKFWWVLLEQKVELKPLFSEERFR